MAATSCAICCEDRCDGMALEAVQEQCMNGHVECANSKHLASSVSSMECEVDMDADYATPIGVIYVK